MQGLHIKQLMEDYVYFILRVRDVKVNDKLCDFYVSLIKPKRPPLSGGRWYNACK